MKKLYSFLSVLYLSPLQFVPEGQIIQKDLLFGLMLRILCKDMPYGMVADRICGKVKINRKPPVIQARNPDAAWESQSLPIGNGSIGANIMGSVEG